MVGTKLLDKKNETNIAKTTASARGTNKNFATPERKNMGTNTIQMHKVATNAGTPISPAPTSMASYKGLPMCKWRSMFSMVTMAWSTKIPTDKAKPPRVIKLSVSPKAYKIKIEEKIDKGMVMAMMSVLLQLPKNKSTMAAVKAAAMIASLTTPLIAAFTKIDWSNN